MLHCYVKTLNGINLMYVERGLLKTRFSDPERDSEAAITKYCNDIIAHFFP
jgi:hypothetical protein